MGTALKVLSFVSVVLGSASFTQAKEWRGLIPLHSTRADVVRLYGQCANQEPMCSFLSGGEDVYVVFSSRDEYADDCVRQLPLDVVMHIQVVTSTGSNLSDLRLDLKRFRRFDSSSPPSIGYEGYYDEEEGVIYDTFKGRLVQVVYIAGKEDRRLCPAYYDKPEKFVSKFSEPPILDVECPNRVRAGGRATLSASIAGIDPNVTPTLDWKVSSGKIVSGQGTWTILIKAPGTNARSITTTVEVGGYGYPLSKSCEIQITNERQGRRPAHH